MEPFEDMRVITVYSCDLMGDERSDIFGRTFEKVYPISGDPIAIQTAEEVAGDKCAGIAPHRRATLESKLLAIVRFVRRFSDIALDGLICEFLMDEKSQMVLHGFWSAAVYLCANENEEARTTCGNEIRRGGECISWEGFFPLFFCLLVLSVSWEGCCAGVCLSANDNAFGLSVR